MACPCVGKGGIVSVFPDGNFIASVYYFSSSNVPREQQVSQAKQDALKALNNNGVDLFKEGVEFIEVKRD